MLAKAVHQCHGSCPPTVVEPDAGLKVLPKATHPEKDALRKHCLCHSCYRVEDVTALCMPSISVKNTERSRRALLLVPKTHP